MRPSAERKRVFLLVLPIVVIPFLALLFYSLGGGQPANKPAVKTNGLNTSVPSAELSSVSPVDKLSLYNQADRDSLKLEELRKHDGFLPNREDGAVEAPFSDQRVGNYPVRSYGYNTSARTEDKVQMRLSELQRELAKMDTASRAQDDGRLLMKTASQPIGSGIQGDVTTVGPAEVDPEMAQLSDMLDKVIRITNPQAANDETHKASVANGGRVFAVSAESNEDATDFFQGRPHRNKTDSLNMMTDSLLPDKRGKIFSVTSAQGNQFFDLENAERSNAPTAISAVIHQTQTVVAQATVKLRLEQPIYIQGQLIPAGAFVYGKCEMSGDRMQIPIKEIGYGNRIYPVSMEVYGLDGQPGIYIEGSITGDVSRKSANDALQSLQLAAMDPTITQQAAAAGIETVKTIVGKKAKLVKMTIKAGHPVLLVDRASR